MKIGYFTNEFAYTNPIKGEISKPYIYGGVEAVVYNLAVEMARKGHEVFIFTSSIDAKTFVSNYDNITIYRYKKSFTIGSAPVSISYLYKPLKCKVDLDIVHGHLGNLPAPLVAYWYSKMNKKPLVITHHGDYVSGLGFPIREVGIFLYNIYFANKLLSNANIIISPSKRYIDISRFLGRYRNKIVFIPNGINLDKFVIDCSREKCREKIGFAKNDKIVLFLGTLDIHKGPDILIKAIPKLLDHISNVKFVFVGKGKMKVKLEEMCNKIGVKNHVRFTGFIEEDLKPLYYHSSDVFCLPSVMNHEIFGIVNLEAMACGIPIIASEIGGVPDVVKNRKNGLLVPPGNSDALADALIFLLKNKEIRFEMGAMAKKEVKNYSWENIANQTERIYEELIK